MNTPKYPLLLELLSKLSIDTPMARELQVVCNRVLNEQIGKTLRKEISQLPPATLEQLIVCLYSRRSFDCSDRRKRLEELKRSLEG